MGVIARQVTVDPPNNPPEWTSTPEISFAAGSSSTHDLKTNTFDAEGDTLAFVKISGTFESWMSLNGSTGVITFTDQSVAGTYTGFSFSADDGTASPVTSSTFSIVVVAITQWTAQDSVSYLPAIRNRNGSVTVAAGRGFGMDGRFSNADWNVSAQTGTAPVIVHVTNRNNSGSGSLREAIEDATVPTDVVFDVGGLISTSSSWNSSAPYMSGKIRICGQTAPSQIIINKTGVGNRFNSNGGDVLYEHIIFWHSADAENPGSDDDNANACTVTGPGSLPSSFRSKILFDHCMFGGGTDQNFLIFDDCADITFLDCLFANPRGKNPGVSRTHQYSAQFGVAGSLESKLPTNISLIGVVYTNGRERNPTAVVPNFSICNSLIYNREKKAVDIRGNSNQELVCFINLVGIWDKRGAQYASNDGAIQLGRTGGAQSFESGSKVYVNDCIAGSTDSGDNWLVVNDFDSQEGAVRQNTVVTESWPDGLVAAPMRSLSDADKLTLMIQNNGPRPNARLSDVQDIYDDIINGDDGTATDYTVPTTTNTSSTYVDVSNPTQEGSESGRTNREEDFLDKAEAFLT